MYSGKLVQIFLIFMAILMLMGVTAATEVTHDTNTDHSEKLVTTDEPIITPEKDMKNKIKENNSPTKTIKKNTIKDIKNEENPVPTRLSLNLNKKNISICEPFTIYGQLTDENNTPLINKSIRYYLDDEFQKTAKTDNTGIFLIEEYINKTKFNDYKNYFPLDIRVKFYGSTLKNKYLNSENSTSIKVHIPMSGNVYAHDYNIRLGQTTQIKGQIFSKRFKALPNQNIMIKCKHESFKNETIIHTRTNHNGEFKHNITPTKLGKYHITLYGPKNNSYYEIYEDEFNVNTYGFAQIEIADELWSCKVGQYDNVIIYGRVFDIVTGEGIPFHKIDNAYLTNNPDHEDVKHQFHKNIPLNATTDKNGNYMLTIPFKKLPQKTINSEYYCILSSKSTREYVTFDSYEGYSILLNIKNRTSIKLNKIATTEQNKTANITGKLLDNKNKSITNAIIKLIINDETVNVTTDNHGIFHYTYKTTINGKNNVTAYYRGNNEHGATLSTTKIHVVKATRIYINKINTTQYKDKIIITGKLTYKTGTILKNTKIKVKVNSKTYTVKTNSKGAYSLKITANKVGTNNVTVTYVGNKYYKAVTKKTTFKTVARATKLTVNKINTTIYGKKVKITGKLTDNLKSPVLNSLVKIKINKKTVTVKTNKQGVYTYNYKATIKGTNTVTITFPGSINYKKTSVKTSFSVK